MNLGTTESHNISRPCLNERPDWGGGTITPNIDNLIHGYEKVITIMKTTQQQFFFFFLRDKFILYHDWITRDKKVRKNSITHV